MVSGFWSLLPLQWEALRIELLVTRADVNDTWCRV